MLIRKEIYVNPIVCFDRSVFFTQITFKFLIMNSGGKRKNDQLKRAEPLFTFTANGIEDLGFEENDWLINTYNDPPIFRAPTAPIATSLGTRYPSSDLLNWYPNRIENVQRRSKSSTKNVSTQEDGGESWLSMLVDDMVVDEPLLSKTESQETLNNDPAVPILAKKIDQPPLMRSLSSPSLGPLVSPLKHTHCIKNRTKRIVNPFKVPINRSTQTDAGRKRVGIQPPKIDTSLDRLERDSEVGISPLSISSGITRRILDLPDNVNDSMPNVRFASSKEYKDISPEQKYQQALAVVAENSLARNRRFSMPISRSAPISRIFSFRLLM